MDKRGSVILGTQEAAESYLRALPPGYAGRTRKTESGKWMVSYHQVEEITGMEPDLATHRREAFAPDEVKAIEAEHEDLWIRAQADLEGNADVSAGSKQ